MDAEPSWWFLVWHGGSQVDGTSGGKEALPVVLPSLCWDLQV